MTCVEQLQAIDVHGHYGRWVQDEARAHMGRCMSGSAETVVARARRARIEWTVVSPLLGMMPRGQADAVAGNEEANRVVDQTDGLLQWVVINPLQPECMDPVDVKRRWGDRIALHGGISLQRTLPYGTPDEVREEVETLIRTCGYNGGLVVFPSNVIQPDTPMENIIACFHAARDFDVASLGGRPG